MTDIEQARELLAKRYDHIGAPNAARHVRQGLLSPAEHDILPVIVEALRAAPEGYVLVDLSNNEVLPHLPGESMIEAGWPSCELISDFFDSVAAYADLLSAARASATLSTVTPPRDLRTKLGEGE